MSVLLSLRMVSGRKLHKCDQCNKAILVDERHWKCAGVVDGDFSSSREHLDCRDAWLELNFAMRSIEPSEGAPFLCDDEHEDDERAWMRDAFPAVARRLGWSA